MPVSQSVREEEVMTINPLFSPHSNSDLFLLSALHRVNVARKPRFFDGAEGGCSNEERVEHRGRKEGRKEGVAEEEPGQ